MANPVMNSFARDLQQQTPAGYPTMPGYQPGAHSAPHMVQPHGLNVDETIAQMEAAYAAPSADGVDTGRLTYDDILTKTGILFGILLASTFLSWKLVAANPGLGWPLVMGASLVGIGLVFVNSLMQTVKPLLVIAYAVVEGAFLGGFSLVMDTAYPGVVMQAVIATAAVFTTMLLLYRSGKVRYTARMGQMLMLGLGGIFLYYLINLVLQLTGVIANPFGLSGMTIAGIPLGVFVGLAAIGLGAFSLVEDFHIAQYGVENGAPAVFAWKVAFGFMVTVVWLYVEIVRLLAILQSND